MPSILLSFAAASAIVLGASAATALPANAAATSAFRTSSGVTSPKGSSTPVIRITSPADVGSILCNGDLCIQRVTSIINNKANIKAWADTTTFSGHFELDGPDGPIANSPTKVWSGGGAGFTFTGVARGGGYTMKAWQGTSVVLGTVHFSV